MTLERCQFGCGAIVNHDGMCPHICPNHPRLTPQEQIDRRHMGRIWYELFYFWVPYRSRGFRSRVGRVYVG